METGLELLKVVITAGAAFAGVWYGQRNSNRKDVERAHLEAEKRQQEKVFVATVVVKHLEAYINACVAAAHDDGTESGYPAGGNGIYRTTTPRPEFDPYKLDVNLQALPSALIYDVLSIPMRQDAAEDYLASPGSFDPPYDEYIWERGHQFAKLGQYAIEVATRLRRSTGLPKEDLSQGWRSREEALAAVVTQYEENLAARARQFPNIGSALPPHSGT